MIKKISIIFLLASFLTAPISAVKAGADFAEIYLTLDKSTFLNPEIISFDLNFNASTTVSVNAIDTRISFNPENLELLSVNASSSICNFFVYEVIDNTEGNYQMMCGTEKDYFINSKIVTLTFKKIKSGITTINTSSDSQALLNNGLGTSLSVSGEIHNIFIFK